MDQKQSQLAWEDVREKGHSTWSFVCVCVYLFYYQREIHKKDFEVVPTTTDSEIPQRVPKNSDSGPLTFPGCKRCRLRFGRSFKGNPFVKALLDCAKLSKFPVWSYSYSAIDTVGSLSSVVILHHRYQVQECWTEHLNMILCNYRTGIKLNFIHALK